VLRSRLWFGWRSLSADAARENPPMCGICGVISADPRPVEPAVRAMMRAMVHRGPDDEGFELLPLGSGESPGPVAGFGFRRLSILDLSQAGHQPMFNERTGDCLIFNGEIYNFRQLRAELQCDGVRFRSTSDTEVLLQSLSTWGESALDKLQGMFAFAFYHAESRRILLARDPLGIKPLYVAALPGRFVFASEVRAVLASGLVPADLDHAGISAMLAYGSPQDPLTVHKHIRSLGAGTFQWVDATATDGRFTGAKKYWCFPHPSDERVSQQDARQQVRALLEQSVADHLVADVPVGVFLSAGIDSISIAAIAKRYNKNVRTFTVGFAEKSQHDEMAEAAIAARAIGTLHTEVVLDSDRILALWDQWLAGADRPSIDGFNTFVVSHAVRAEGKIVALSGLGGDEIFGGYPQFDSLPRLRRWLRLAAPLPEWLKRSLLRAITYRKRESFRNRAEELLLGSTSIRRLLLSLRRILTDKQLRALGVPVKATGLNNDFLVGDAGLEEPLEQSERQWRNLEGDFETISRLESTLYMSNTLLRDTDVVSMASSQEVRVPFLDRRLVDRVASLPTAVKWRKGAPPKGLLRQACQDLIPADLLNRPKTGFTLPVDRWMHGPLRESCEAYISVAAECGVLDPEGVQSLWSEFVRSEAHVHWVRPMTLIALGNYLTQIRKITAQ
jgi:asparagine synthase (glutamine-hydrolysing)